MSDEQESNEPQPSELEREERRLERLRLVVAPWPNPHFEEAAQPPVREADRWKGSGGTGRFPQLDPTPPAAA